MRVLVLTSGGVDSTTSLGMAVEKYGKENVVSMSVSYGQKHSKELEASKAVAEYYGVEHIYVNLAEIFKYSDCSLLEHSDKDIPHDTVLCKLEADELFCERCGAPLKSIGKEFVFLIYKVITDAFSVNRIGFSIMDRF